MMFFVFFQMKVACLVLAACAVAVATPAINEIRPVSNRPGRFLSLPNPQKCANSKYYKSHTRLHIQCCRLPHSDHGVTTFFWGERTFGLITSSFGGSCIVVVVSFQMHITKRKWVQHNYIKIYTR